MPGMRCDDSRTYRAAGCRTITRWELFVNESLTLVAVVICEFDEAIDFYINTLGFQLIENTPLPEQQKR